MRIGVFGGTFDPVHYGHLLLAESCREQCQLDEVWLVPAATPPHKRQQDLTPAKSRLTMLELAIAGHGSFRLSTLELDRGGLSYTVQTLTEIHTCHPEAELFFLMGGDSLRDLPTWREPARICELAIPTVVVRAGAPAPDFNCLQTFVSSSRMEQIRTFQVTMPVIELSSSEIRTRVAAGQSIRFRTPRGVEKFIETNGLYRPLPPT